MKTKVKGRSLGRGGQAERKTSRGTDSLDVTDFLPTETMHRLNRTSQSSLPYLSNTFFSFSFSV